MRKQTTHQTELPHTTQAICEAMEPRLMMSATMIENPTAPSEPTDSTPTVEMAPLDFEGIDGEATASSATESVWDDTDIVHVLGGQEGEEAQAFIKLELAKVRLTSLSFQAGIIGDWNGDGTDDIGSFVALDGIDGELGGAFGTVAIGDIKGEMDNPLAFEGIDGELGGAFDAVAIGDIKGEMDNPFAPSALDGLDGEMDNPFAPSALDGLDGEMGGAFDAVAIGDIKGEMGNPFAPSALDGLDGEMGGNDMPRAGTSVLSLLLPAVQAAREV